MIGEYAARFGPGSRLIGIVSEPPANLRNAQAPAVIVPNSGFLHRVGPNALHVRMCRVLAARGLYTLRFDLSGLGDSLATDSDETLGARALRDAAQAQEFLRARYGSKSFVVAGICSGADLGFNLALRDSSIVGLVLVNGGLIDADVGMTALDEQAVLRSRLRGYRQRALRPESWMRLLSGRSNLPRMLSTGVRALLSARDRGASVAKGCSAMEALERRRVPILGVYSAGSAAWDAVILRYGSAHALARYDNLDLRWTDNADHIFTTRGAQGWLIDCIVEWAVRELNGERKSNMQLEQRWTPTH